MFDYLGARAVAMIVRMGSFEAAAQMLNVTPSAVSQRIKSLEDRMGTVLIHRGQPCRATEAGARLCRHMEHVSMLEAAFFADFPGIAPSGPTSGVTLEIATNSDSLGSWLLPGLASFAEQSAYLFNIAIDDEHHTAEWLHQGRVLAAVTSLERPVRGCVVHALGRLRYFATASPEFIDRYFPEGVTPETLAKAPALMFNQKDNHQIAWVQQQFCEHPVLPCHFLPSTQGFVDACCAGLGWGMNPASLVKHHLASGALVHLHDGQPYDVSLFWQISRLAADPLQALTQAVIMAAKRGLEPPVATA